SSLESRFLVTARKFPSTGIVAEELDAVAELDARSRGVSAEELTRPRSKSFDDRGPTDLRDRHTGTRWEPRGRQTAPWLRSAPSARFDVFCPAALRSLRSSFGRENMRSSSAVTTSSTASNP